MAILAEAQFYYTFRLRRGADAVWRGHAQGSPDSGRARTSSPTCARCRSGVAPLHPALTLDALRESVAQLNEEMQLRR
jgi:hypothetical protein